MSPLFLYMSSRKRPEVHLQQEVHPAGVHLFAHAGVARDIQEQHCHVAGFLFQIRRFRGFLDDSAYVLGHELGHVVADVLQKLDLVERVLDLGLFAAKLHDMAFQVLGHLVECLGHLAHLVAGPDSLHPGGQVA